MKSPNILVRVEAVRVLMTSVNAKLVLYPTQKLRYMAKVPESEPGEVGLGCECNLYITPTCLACACSAYEPSIGKTSLPRSKRVKVEDATIIIPTIQSLIR